MTILSQFRQPAEWSSLTAESSVTPLSENEWLRLRPDAHWVLHADHRILARCSVWYNSLPATDGVVPATIGHFEAIDEQSGVTLLTSIVDHFRKGSPVKYVVGPMDANTWNRYRLVTDSDGRPPFLMEPDHPAFYPNIWRRVGFTSVADYHSAELPLLFSEDPRLQRAIARLQEQGITLRNLRMNDYQQELHRIHRISCDAFAHNYFYTPIDSEAFDQLYAPYRDKIDPRLVFLVEKQGETIGFLFGMADFLQAMRGESMDTVIFKTIAVRQHRELAGLGLWMIHHGHQQAAHLGFKRVIHALVTSQSKLQHLGGQESLVFRRYSLFGLSLS